MELDPYSAELYALQRRRALADSMIQQGMDQTPIRHWSQAAARMVNGIMGQREAAQIDEQMRGVAGRREAERSAELQKVSELMAPREVAPMVPNDDDGNPMPSVQAPKASRADIARALIGMKSPQFQQMGLQMAMQKPADEEAYTLKPGESRFRGGQVVASLPEVVKPEKPEADPEIVRLQRIADDPKRSSGERAVASKQIAKLTREPSGESGSWAIHPQDPTFQVHSKTGQIRKAEYPGGASPANPKAREDADSLRKEFAANPAVKTFGEVKPIIESARKAPDTKQGDFALIYGVGKVLDPNSVVREGEMNLVIASGSPAQRVMGYLRQLQGKGRITPEARAELMTILSQRAGEYEAQYDSARESYGQIAERRGYNPDDIFVGSPYKAKKDDAGAKPATVSGLAKPRSKQERDALPPGTQYQAPDGSIRTR